MHMRPRKRRLKKLRPLIQTKRHHEGREEANHGPIVRHRRRRRRRPRAAARIRGLQRGTPAGSGPRRRRAAGRASHSRSPRAAAREATAWRAPRKSVAGRRPAPPEPAAARPREWRDSRICWFPAGAARAVRSCGSNATERANKARDKAAQTAANKLSASGISLGRQPAERVGHQPKKRAIQLRLPGPAGNPGHLLQAAQRHPTIECDEVNGQSACGYQPRQECGDKRLLRTDFAFRCHAAGQC